MKVINDKIKEIYKSKASFSREIGIRPKDFSRKLKSFDSKIKWINNFLEPLGLAIEIVELEKAEVIN